jgi:hypothetical protein
VWQATCGIRRWLIGKKERKFGEQEKKIHPIVRSYNNNCYLMHVLCCSYANNTA